MIKELFRIFNQYLTINGQTLEVVPDVTFAIWLLENYPEHYKEGDSVSDMAKRVITTYGLQRICLEKVDNG